MNTVIQKILDDEVLIMMKMYEQEGKLPYTVIDDDGTKRVMIGDQTEITILPVSPNEDSFFMRNNEKFEKIFPYDPVTGYKINKHFTD
jgi:hypothetical protein